MVHEQRKKSNTSDIHNGGHLLMKFLIVITYKLYDEVFEAGEDISNCLSIRSVNSRGENTKACHWNVSIRKHLIHAHNIVVHVPLYLCLHFDSDLRPNLFFRKQGSLPCVVLTIRPGVKDDH